MESNANQTAITAYDQLISAVHYNGDLLNYNKAFEIIDTFCFNGILTQNHNIRLIVGFLHNFPTSSACYIYETKEIVISKWYVQASTPKSMFKTVDHEIAHAACGCINVTSTNGHGKLWQMWSNHIEVVFGGRFTITEKCIVPTLELSLPDEITDNNLATR